MQSFIGGSRLDTPLVFKLDHPVRHLCRTYTEFTFHRRASIDDVHAGQRVKNNDRKMASLVLGRLAKVPRGVMDKVHPEDFWHLVTGTNSLFRLV